jgi:hypothetical protein
MPAVCKLTSDVVWCCYKTAGYQAESIGPSIPVTAENAQSNYIAPLLDVS